MWWFILIWIPLPPKDKRPRSLGCLIWFFVIFLALGWLVALGLKE